MKRKRKLALVILLVLLMTLSGCGIKSRHMDAIEDAIVNYSDYYIELSDLGKQVRRQARGLTGYEDAAEYTLDIQVPDYSLIDVDEVKYQEPAVDYAKPDADAWLEELGKAIRQSVENYAFENPMEGYVDSQITMDLKLVDGKWQADISPASKRQIAALVDGMMDDKIGEIGDLPKEYDFVRVAEQKKALFTSLVGGSGYIDAITVTGVEDMGGGKYRLLVSYPDPAATFQSLGDAFVDSFSTRVFGSVECTLDPNDYKADSSSAASKSGSIVVAMDGNGSCTVEDGEAFFEEYTAARAAAEAAAAEAVNARYAVPEVARPTRNTILYGSSNGPSAFDVTLTKEAPDTFIRLYRINSSIQEEGALQVSYYVRLRAGTFRVWVPAGTYKVVVAYGDTWYGPEYMFGPEGTYLVYEEAISLKADYGWEFEIVVPWAKSDWMLDYAYDVDITV